MCNAANVGKSGLSAEEQPFIFHQDSMGLHNAKELAKAIRR